MLLTILWRTTVKYLGFPFFIWLTFNWLVCVCSEELEKYKCITNTQFRDAFTNHPFTRSWTLSFHISDARQPVFNNPDFVYGGFEISLMHNRKQSKAGASRRS